MTDKQFEDLKKSIQITMDVLKRLQAKYRQQTGRDFVPDVKA